MAANNAMSSVVGWLLLPPLAAKVLLRVVHWVLRFTWPRAVPQAGTSRHALHGRISYVVVVATYLAYTIWAAEQDLGDNFYHALGLRPDAFDAQQLRRNFRRLSLQLHPDKNPEGAPQFILVQHAYNVLSDPLRRFAYDRAGEAAVLCESCKTASDYMLSALPQRLVVHIGYVLVSVAMQVFRVARSGSYWRYAAIAGFAALELAMMTRTAEPLFIRGLLWLAPRRTAFEIALVLRQALTCFFVAVNQIGPQLIPQDKAATTLDLARELLGKTRATAAEVQGRAARLAGFYKNTGLQRHMVESFESELLLGMTLGTSPAFRGEFTDRLGAVRSRLAPQ
ncbi:hypothetical protein IWQ57_005172 [Coemansia nantahalensis]|uniref:Uncharacterized protein n=1 Tax=Coemansia nantahalensis TaxID=2789366 RepID=A0ACC1JNY2_9FUNG|nr:hypothetical protein IWQ57_005172 [Coemansia nantahalensis]